MAGCLPGRSLMMVMRTQAAVITDRTASVVIRGPRSTQKLRCGYVELGVEVASVFRLATAFEEVRLAI